MKNADDRSTGENDMIFRDDVQCFVKTLNYDFKTRVGQLFLEDRSCTDMSGCIGLFKKIDPDVRAIQTIAGKRRDTYYAIIDGEWQARTDPRQRD